MDIDEFLRKVDRNLFGVSKKTRETIKAELKSHIVDLASKKGEANEETIAEVLEGMQSPKVIARNHKAIYGYSSGFMAVLVIIAILLSILTLPTNPAIPYSDVLSMILLPILTAYVIFVSIFAGKTAGVSAGAASAICRIAAFFAVFSIYRKEFGIIEEQMLSLFGFVLVSILLIIVGYLPGEVKARWVKLD